MNTFTGAAVKSSSSLPSIEEQQSSVRNYTELAGRILLAVPFLLSGLGKLGAYSATAGYMSAVGVPGVLLPAVIATEVLGGLAIIFGWKTRVVAFLLAGFCLLTALIFHRNFADQMQMINFLKNVSMAGGFLVLVAHGGGWLSVDRRLAK
jgi:putative oxidoreductase